MAPFRVWFRQVSLYYSLLTILSENKIVGERLGLVGVSTQNCEITLQLYNTPKIYYIYRSVWHQTHFDLTSQMKTIPPLLKIWTYIITSITGHPVRLAVILAIVSVSTFKTAVILYIVDMMHVFNIYRQFIHFSFVPTKMLHR